MFSNAINSSGLRYLVSSLEIDDSFKLEENGLSEPFLTFLEFAITLLQVFITTLRCDCPLKLAPKLAHNPRHGFTAVSPLVCGVLRRIIFERQKLTESNGSSRIQFPAM